MIERVQLPSDRRCRLAGSWLLLLSVVVSATIARGASSIPVLKRISPPGGQVGTTFSLSLAGENLDNVTELCCSNPRIGFKRLDLAQFEVSIPEDVQTGQYDLQAMTPLGLTAPRAFFVGRTPECYEQEPNDVLSAPQTVAMHQVVNGHLTQGDVDYFVLKARQGQRIIIDCKAERIHSPLRAVLELYDPSGKRVAVNRGWVGRDPLIAFLVPGDGNYIVKLVDLVHAGGDEYSYRLSIDSDPHVVVARPCVVERDKPTRVALFGWNFTTSLNSAPTTHDDKTGAISTSANDALIAVDGQAAFESTNVEITPSFEMATTNVWRQSHQVVVEGFAYRYPAADTPIWMGVTDVPVVLDESNNHSATMAQTLDLPCEVSGQLAAGDEQDWFAINVRSGEVIWLESFGERLGAPVDLDITLFGANGESELASFQDEFPVSDAPSFTTRSFDASGRWVAPANGRYLLMVRNLIGGTGEDPRRIYRLSVRREEPVVDLVAVPRSTEPLGLNVSRGGRLVMDVVAVRRRGHRGAIRVSARDLPTGVECSETWIGPGVSSAPLVVSARGDIGPLIGKLILEGHLDQGNTCTIQGGTIVRKTPGAIVSRITDEIRYSVTGDAPMRLTAACREQKHHALYGDLKLRYSPGCILDIVVEVERTDTTANASVRLSAIGIHGLIANQTATIPEGSNRGIISLYLPPTLPVGRYSLAIQGEVALPTKTNGPGNRATTDAMNISSNAVSFDVEAGAFVVEVPPSTPRKIHRGEVVQVSYSARRINGFIGKIHTELDAADEVVGLRGRGVTFVGQSETGTIQVIASDDAPLGRQPFLRLHGVGVLEDRPLYHSGCFLDLEIVE